MVTSLADCKPMVIILDDEGILSLTLLSGIESWVAFRIMSMFWAILLKRTTLMGQVN